MLRRGVRFIDDVNETSPLTQNQLQRLALSIGMSVEDVVSFGSKISLDFLMERGVDARALRSANVTPMQLKALGAESCRSLVALGCNSIDLIDKTFCASCIAAFGTENILENFLVSPGDAVALAGAPMRSYLGICVERLLLMCAGAPDAAEAVIEQVHPRSVALVGIPIESLLDTQIKSDALTRLGFSKELIASHTYANANDLKMLGFGV